MADTKLQIVVDEATGQFQLFVDGVQMSDDEAVEVTKRLLADAGAVLGGPLTMESGIEFHRNPNAQHVHLVSENRHTH